jgi:hypothetical protein
LDETGVHELATRADGLPEAIPRAVWQQSGGHPFLATYLLHHLWKAGIHRGTETSVINLAEQFMQQEATHLETWSRAIGLAGLQIYGLFVDAPDWIERRTFVRTVKDPKVPVTRALASLCYHGLIMPNPTWNWYHRGGDLFLNWYVQEIPRLIAELTPLGPTSVASPPFWIQLISNGTLQTVFDQRGQQIETQYNKEITMGNKTTISNVSGSIINVDSMLEHVTQNISTLPKADQATKEELTQLVAQLTDLLKQAPPEKADEVGKIADRVDTLVNEAGKDKPDQEKVEFSLESLKKAAENIAGVLPTVLPIAMQIAENIRKLVP